MDLLFQGKNFRQSRTPALRIAVAVAGLLLLAGLAAPLRAEAQTGEKPAASGTNGAKTSNGAKPSNGTKAGNGANGAKSAPAPAAPPAPAAAAPAPAPSGPVDVAFGAYQAGNYLTAYKEAMKRVEAGNDPAAMTLL
ncbi:MAG: hypothetical protein B7Y12_22345, partial [Rhizobiales bacterium 24-66-13]